MDYAWGANGLDAIITQVFLRNIFECFKLINVLIQKIFFYICLYLSLFTLFFLFYFFIVCNIMHTTKI